MSEDPFPGFAALPQTQHPYVYVGNDPINLTDPSGQNPLLIGALAGGAIGAVAGWTGYVLANPGGRPEDYLASHDFWRAGQVGLASGVVAGAVGWAVPALLPAAGGFWGAVGIGALTGSLAGGAGQITSNLLTARLVNPCVKWHHNLVQSMIIGGVTGGIIGGAGWKIGQWVKTSGLPKQLHHYATNKNNTYTPQFERILRRYGLSLDDAWNTELLPHQGRHPNQYHEFVLNGMQRAAQEAGDDASRFLQLFERYVMQPVRNNPELLRKSGW
ncbi:MAG: hypothetical protein GY833_01555 [Aestuariibacter sp.]|nr:hypothetical protein [Aestuariibacter sp.]